LVWPEENLGTISACKVVKNCHEIIANSPIQHTKRPTFSRFLALHAGHGHEAKKEDCPPFAGRLANLRLLRRKRNTHRTAISSGSLRTVVDRCLFKKVEAVTTLYY